MKAFHLTDVVRLDTIFFDVPGRDRIELIRNIVELLADREEILDSDILVRAALEREEELPTGIEAGIALPHARTDAVRSLLCAFVRPVEPLDFASPDGKPCDLIFFSAVPTDGVDDYLRLTASLIRTLHRSDIAEKLRAAKSPEDMLSVLEHRS